MRHRTVATLAVAAVLAAGARAAHAYGDLTKVNHFVFMMQENRSFDNYFGALPYVPDGPYHPCLPGAHRTDSDHRCVDGLTCTPGAGGELTCSNFNLDQNGQTVFAFHDPRICDLSGLDHGWPESHREANWEHPGATSLTVSPNDGFVRQNASDNPHQDTAFDTIGFRTQAELPFYYGLAQAFAINDHYHASVIGPTLPNRLYYMAATSFGHTTTGEAIPPIPAGYQPIGGTLLDLMDQHHVSWMNYYQDLPASFYLRPYFSDHVATIDHFATDLADGKLADVTFVDADFGILNPATEADEAPPNNIRRGEAYVAHNIALIRNSPFWKDTIIIVTYDEHGGAYDHVSPPLAKQHRARTPDGIYPGQCADLSAPPQSKAPGGGAHCDLSRSDAAETCPGFTATGPYPATCPAFDTYGFRVPFIAVSPFAKPQYVSHTLGDHTSLTALVEKRFMTRTGRARNHPALTLRDRAADTLEDMFDFEHSPSLDTPLPPMPPGESPDDAGCH